MHDDQQQDAIERGHEPITLSGRAVAKGFSILYGVLIVTLLLMAGFMFLFSKIDGGEATVDAPAQTSTTPSGVPTLDSDQSGSLRALRTRERQLLTEYRWVDAEAGLARIPIKRAMELLSQPTRFPVQTSNDGAVHQ
jgi:hypothetical protein